MSGIEFDWSYPYPSQRAPVFARNVVATSHPLAAGAGVEMLRRGGNAVDAAVAAAVALTVVEPTSNGIGSDAFALVWSGGRLHGLNASGRSGAAFDASAFSGMERIPYYGWGGVTTPGAVSGWVALSERFGRMGLSACVEPAVRYAREGFHVPPEVAHWWGVAAGRYDRDAHAEWFRVFAPGGRGPKVGEVVRLPEHARTLELIAETGGRAFYEGELAEAMDAASRAGGGSLRKGDLESHEAEWVEPIDVGYGGYRLHEIPPNGQGLAALMALGIMKELGVADAPADSTRSVHLQMEAMKLAFADAHRYIADPAHMDVRVEDLLDGGYLRERAGLVDGSRATDFGHGRPKRGGTVYLSAADAEGNMVSFIQSNYTGFGSGVVVPGTGIALQNRGCNFTLERGHPNEAGPGKRPYHTIIPGFLTTEGGAPAMSFGVMGGFMQPQGHAQVVQRMVDHGQNPQSALDAPRWRVDEGLRVRMEPGFAMSVYEELRAMGHGLEVEERRNSGFGRGQTVWLLGDGGYAAGSEPRCDGQAQGF